MKRLLILSALLISFICVNAQTKYVSSETRQTCFWDTDKQQFSACSNSENYECLFTLNVGETMFVHTTKDIKSSYYVKNKTYDQQSDLYTYDVVSDVGNKYQFILGKSAANLVILSTGHANAKEDYIMKYPIKRQWND